MVREATRETGNRLKGNPGYHPNSIAALQKNRLTWARCSRDTCNRPRYKKSKSGFCWKCWKRWEYPRLKSAGNYDPTTDDNTVARLRYYKDRMGPKLNAFVEECLAQPESDQYNLSEELAVARDLLGEAIELYERAKLLPDANPNKSLMLVNAGSMLSNASKEVREICKTGADVFDKAKDKFSIHAIVEIVGQVKRLIRQCFGHDELGLEEFDRVLTKELRLPRIGNDGTTITADQDVIDMDATVPRVPEPIVIESAMLLLECLQCNQQFNHPDENCVCPNCESPLRVVEQ